MAIVSLGAAGSNTTYDFDSPFTIVSQGVGFFGGGPNALEQLPGDILRGNQGHGTIQFIGTFSTFSWVVPTPESWHGFTFGIRTTEALEPSVDLQVAHRLPASGYIVDPASIQPTADTATASEDRLAERHHGYRSIRVDRSSAQFGPRRKPRHQYRYRHHRHLY